jgi:hypothetical protein
VGVADLDALGRKYKTDKSSAHHDYLRTYERILPQGAVSLMEFGVYAGASIRMWAEWLPLGRIVGVEAGILPGGPFPPNVTLVRADCRLPLVEAPGIPTQVDVIIDDASHVAEDMIAALRAHWSRLAPGGRYILEDVCCLWWPGYGSDATAGAFGSALLRLVNADGRKLGGSEARGRLPDWQDPLTGLSTAEVAGVHFYNSLIVIDKAEA